MLKKDQNMDSPSCYLIPVSVPYSFVLNKPVNPELLELIQNNVTSKFYLKLFNFFVGILCPMPFATLPLCG